VGTGRVALRRLTRLVTGLGLPLVDSVGEALQLIRGSEKGPQRR
jgi:hypothetical protein